MKKKIFIAVAFVAAIVTTGKLYAQEAKTKEVMEKKEIKCSFFNTENGCVIVFDKQENASEKGVSKKPSFVFEVNSKDGGIEGLDDWEVPTIDRQSKGINPNVVCSTTHLRQENKPAVEIIDCPVVNGVCSLPVVEDGDYICDFVFLVNSGKEKSINVSFDIKILQGQLHIHQKDEASNKTNPLFESGGHQGTSPLHSPKE